MAITASDIIIRLSGGSANTDNNLSIGGESSTQGIVGVNNNLFDNVSDEEAKKGHTDFRCVYISNEGSEVAAFDVFIDSEVEGGADIQIGIREEAEVQRITIFGTITGGSFRVSFEGEETADMSHDVDTETWATNIEDGLNALSNLSGVAVSIEEENGETAFLVSFEGDDINKDHDLMELTDNSLIGCAGGDYSSAFSSAFTITTACISISLVSDGHPINSTANEIALDTNPPFNVDFSSPTSESPIPVGTLDAGDNFPLWVKRVVRANTTHSTGTDGFTLGILAE